jgi:hypothetical protein
VTKLLTVKRSTLFVAFLALALVGMATLQGVPSAKTMPMEQAYLESNDVAYAESNATVDASTGYVSGSTVSFGLDGASASSTTVANGPAVDGVDYQSYANTIASDLSAGAASASVISVNVSGYSLPLQYDTYLPAYVAGTWNGTDYYAETSWSGTVLARAGFSTDNPDIEMSNSSASFGYEEEVYGGGGGGGGGCNDTSTSYQELCQPEYMQRSSFRRFGGGTFLMPAALRQGKGKSYKVTAKKWDAGETHFKSGKIKKWNSRIPHTEDLGEVGLSVETTGIQYDAASGTFNVKQKVRVKKVKKASKKSLA